MIDIFVIVSSIRIKLSAKWHQLKAKADAHYAQDDVIIPDIVICGFLVMVVWMILH